MVELELEPEIWVLILCTVIVLFIWFTIKLEGRPSAGAPYWINSVFGVPTFVVLNSTYDLAQ